MFASERAAINLCFVCVRVCVSVCLLVVSKAHMSIDIQTISMCILHGDAPAARLLFAPLFPDISPWTPAAASAVLAAFATLSFLLPPFAASGGMGARRAPAPAPASAPLFASAHWWPATRLLRTPAALHLADATAPCSCLSSAAAASRFITDAVCFGAAGGPTRRGHLCACCSPSVCTNTRDSSSLLICCTAI